MKAPICGICLNSDMLCMACKKKLDEGDISELDVKASRIVHEAAKRFRQLENITIKKVLEGTNVMVMLCGSGDRSKIIGKEGVIINRLSKTIGKNVRVVEETPDFRKFVENLIYPVPLLGMNVVYSTEGEMLKVIISKNKNLTLPEASFREVIRLVFGKNAAISRT
jgi:transcription antitermination factor NusA-like protein